MPLRKTQFASIQTAPRVPKSVDPFQSINSTIVLLGPYLEVSQQPDVSSDLMCRRPKTRQRCKDVDVDLTRIRLGRDRIRVLKPTQFRDAFIQRLYLLVVTVEEGQKTGLSARRPFSAAEAKVVSRPFEVPKIPKEFLSRHKLTTFVRYGGENKPESRG